MVELGTYDGSGGSLGLKPQTIHIFSSGDAFFGYTLDASGANLPGGIGPQPWVKVSTIKVEPGEGPRAGPQMVDIQAGIERDGWFVARDVATVARAG